LLLRLAQVDAGPTAAGCQQAGGVDRWYGVDRWCGVAEYDQGMAA
jgi:hypothetical protein